MQKKTFWIFILLFYCAVFSQDRDSIFTWPSATGGFVFTNNKRDAFIDIPSLQKSGEVDKGELMTIGGSFGWRFPLQKRFRLQCSAVFDVGYVPEDTLSAVNPVDNTLLALYNNLYYYHFDLQPQIHIAVTTFQKNSLYGIFGVGADLVWLQERMFSKDGVEYNITNRNNINSLSVACDAVAGLGCDIAFNNQVGLFINGMYRFLYPVSYPLYDDYLLTVMNCHETLSGVYFIAGIVYKM